MTDFRLARVLTAIAAISVVAAATTWIWYPVDVTVAWTVIAIVWAVWAYIENRREHSARRIRRTQDRLLREIGASTTRNVIAWPR